jgi:predicted DCC family thiol-disulfide oxidoreductase YuxK
MPTAHRSNDIALELFFDGECPLCTREVALLRRIDRRERVRFTDIASPAFDPASLGVSLDVLMARIHARLPSGELIEGVEVFRRAYEAVGLGALSKLSRLPGVRTVADAAYSVFARNRLKLTGRCTRDSCAVR